jgi:hypothetical protein
LPPPYRHASPTLADPDPFRRDTLYQQRARLGSQSSWLTSTNGSHSTVSTWSFSTTEQEPSVQSAIVRDCYTPSTLVSSRPNTPALGSAQPLGGYGYVPRELERGISLSPSALGTIVELSLIRNFAWLLFILVPYVSLSLLQQ